MYSEKGIRMIAPKLTHLNNLPYTAVELRQEAANRAKKLSIQGVQPKLSASVSIVDQEFKIVDQFGTYIIKPQNDLFPQLPENEDVTMRMAKAFGLEVPFHGMLYGKDGSLSYFIKRFDRYGKGKKWATEDFAQLTGNTRDTKYRFTMEKLIPVLDDYCTFPAIEKADFFKRILFCYLLNSSIAIKNPDEEIALPLKGKKSNLKSTDFIDYYAIERLQLNEKTITIILEQMKKAIPLWKELLEISFLSDEMKIKYLRLLETRVMMFE